MIRTYRHSIVVHIIGGVMTLSSATAVGTAGFSLMRSGPMYINTRRDGSSHILADQGDKVALMVVFSLPAILGIFVLLGAINQSVTLDPDAVVVRNSFRRVTFRADYPDLVKLEACGSSSSKGYVLRSHSQKTTIQPTISGIEDLILELIARAPQLQIAGGCAPVSP